MSSVERALWRAAMRDVEPLPGHALPPEPAPVAAAPVPDQPALATSAPTPRARPAPMPTELPTLTYARTPGLDRRTAERLKRGQLPIEARLDLHGMTQDEARHALDRFITHAYDRALRAVLIITGKGLKPRARDAEPWDPAPGVLKNQTPRWLNELPNRARVLAFTAAQPRDGGSGALYVLIRRRRE
ncbi:MAG TPA: Smr/MutS family protein [Aliidongia sp.]|nr:Smr/MutS family protein [Aliidongia sp.]